MMRRALLTIFLILTATTSSAAPPPVNPADALAFMNQLWSRAVELLNNKTDPTRSRTRGRENRAEPMVRRLTAGGASL